MPYTGVCPTCGKAFGSRRPKVFCGLRCYIDSPQLKAQLMAQHSKATAAAILKKTGEDRKPNVEIACLNCGVKRIVNPSEAKRRKYCNALCYRQYMAGRFDRWIASPQAIALPQAFDEFLSQESLPCLVDGCNWEGKRLGNHVNFAHGISAEEFKRAAGFNLKTGLVTPEMFQKLSERPHIHLAFMDEASEAARARGRQPPPVRRYRSLEGAEHSAKARALLTAGPSTKSPQICIACGAEFQPGPLDVNIKYCSIECRERWYKANRDALKFWLQCAKCLKDFEGSLDQQRRFERGHQVFCGRSCKGIHNASFRGKRSAAMPNDQPSG